MISFTIYTLIIITVSIFKIPDRKTKGNQLGLALLMIAIFIMAAFRRYDVGNDTQSYLSFFSQISLGNIAYDPRIEPGYRYLNLLVSLFSNNFTWILIISSFLLLFPAYSLFRKFSDNPKLCVLLFWMLGFTTLVSATRQAIAVGFLCIATQYLVKRKPSLFIMFCIIASLFHYIAIIFIVLMPLADRQLNLVSGLAGISVLIIFMLAIPIFYDFFSFTPGLYYLIYLGRQSGLLAVIFHTSLGLFFLLFENMKKRSKANDSYQSRLYNIAEWSTIFYSVFFLISSNINISGRVAFLFIPPMILYVAHVCKRKLLLTTITIVVFFIYNSLAIVFRPEWNSFFPFYFFWQ